jgi:hypothetical protein
MKHAVAQIAPTAGDLQANLVSTTRGIPITNWRWDQVTGQEAFRDRTWGTYHVTGLYDGSSFTVTGARQPVPGNASR